MRLFVVLVALISFSNFTCGLLAKHAPQSRSHNDGAFCPKVCKNPGNSTGHGSGSSTIVYVSQSKTVFGFYDSSTGYAFLLDWNTHFFLIINVKSDASAIFSWTTGKGYYISSSVNVALIYSGSGSRESVIAYFRSITSLQAVYNAYVQHGKSFSFNEFGGQAAVIIEGFIKATFSSAQGSFSTTKEWASFASLVYATFSESLRGVGIYEIYSSGVEIIAFLLHHNGNGGGGSGGGGGEGGGGGGGGGGGNGGGGGGGGGGNGGGGGGGGGGDNGGGGGGGGNNSSWQLIQNFLQILTQLGEDNSHFNDSINQLLQAAGINQSSPQLIGFLRFLELLSSLNQTAAANANSSTPLTQFLLPNSRFTVHDFEEILRSTPGLERFLRIFIQSQSWTSIFGSGGWSQICSNVPGLQQFLQFARQNPGFGGFLKLGEGFADAVKGFAKSVADVANSFPIPNPFAPVISGFAGGVAGVASQAGNGLHLVDGIFGGIGGSNSTGSK